MKNLKKTSSFRPMICSRHPSHKIFRRAHKNLPLFPFKSVIRFGSSTELEDDVTNGGNRIEINTVASIKTSANKLLMKEAFRRAEVKTAAWCKHDEIHEVNEDGLQLIPVESGAGIAFPIVAKAKYGSKGQGNTLIKTFDEYLIWKDGKVLNQYIFEKFTNFGLEFRLHVTEEGCFYTCRKALRKDCSEDQKWRHHDDTCVWLLETNPDFKKPNSFNDIEQDCVKALKEIGADILSFDVKVQGPLDAKGNLRPYQDYILLECNSASSMGDYIEGQPSICSQNYLKILPKLLIKKYNKNV